MKICVCGAQCVGKSTFIADILEAYPEFKTSDYNYRDAIKESKSEKNINKRTNIKTQKIIFKALANEIITAPNNVILDRCIIDAIAYTTWPILYDTVNTDIIPEDVDALTSTAMNLIDMYDIIIYIPVDESIKLEDDNFRDVDPEYRRQMAKIFEDLLIFEKGDPKFDKYGYKVVAISGTREERVRDFSELIIAARKH